ncbi:MAG: sugar-binding domain-containing protein [Candidatus Shapirobacteria bacterium]|jgi:DNA-binding transcriptional regulator LsrR (DeoR family)
MNEQLNSELLTRIAWLYYYEDQSQQEIGELLGLPRIKITRLLKTIREQKIVDIKIEKKHFSLFSLEKKFSEATGLADVTIVPTGKDAGDIVAAAAAEHFIDSCRKYERIGIGASRIVSRMFEKINSPIPRIKVKYFVSLTGNAMPNFAANPYSGGWTLSKTLGADFYHIWAPAIATTPEVANILRHDYVIEPVLKMANSVDYAIMGIGDIQNSLLFSHGFLAEKEVSEVMGLGAVGEIFGHFFSIDGALLRTEMQERAICADFPMKCPMMAIAYGEEKVNPIIGALKGKLISALIIDEKTALAVLNAKW